MPHALLALLSVLLAGERLQFDEQFHPRFTAHQLAATATSTREGLAKWAATAEGRAILTHFRADDLTVDAIESPSEPSLGRAPQPGMATLLAANDAKKVKRYELLLNPRIADEYRRDDAIHLGEPATPADVMATAWAGEMLHIEFYSRGIQLPHHERSDFQSRWHTVAEQLGFPLMEHRTSVDGGPP
jgi:hypothetical protein